MWTYQLNIKNNSNELQNQPIANNAKDPPNYFETIIDKRKNYSTIVPIPIIILETSKNLFTTFKSFENNVGKIKKFKKLIEKYF